jgi:hypothetical protein
MSHARAWRLGLLVASRRAFSKLQALAHWWGRDTVVAIVGHIVGTIIATELLLLLSSGGGGKPNPADLQVRRVVVCAALEASGPGPTCNT